MRLALICPDLTGHLNPLTTLGRELFRRGHRVTVCALPPGAGFAARAGLDFAPLGVANYDTEIAPARRRLAELTGIAALKLTGKILRDIEALGLRDLPGIFRDQQIDAVVVDQVSPSGACAAEALGLPFVVACDALQLHQEPGVPPALLNWRYRRGFLTRLRNRLGNQLLGWASAPIKRVIDAFRVEHRLPPLLGGIIADYGLAQVAQQPAFFDFPRTRLPAHFHYTGPWHATGRDGHVDFPWERLDGRPVVYASLGTLQNGLGHVFTAMIEACATLPVQLVLSLGRAGATWDGPNAANAIILPYVPQLEILKRSRLVITHAGLNTALECLTHGRPMLAVPITNDQPGVARRIQWLGVGEQLAPRRVTALRLRGLLQELLDNPLYARKAHDYQEQLAGLDGVRLASDIVERAFSTGKPVLRTEWSAAKPRRRHSSRSQETVSV